MSEREGVRRAWFTIEPRPRTLNSERLRIPDALPTLDINVARMGSERCELEIEIVREVGSINPELESMGIPLRINTDEVEGAGHVAIERLAFNLLWEINESWELLDQLPRDWREAIDEERWNDWLTSHPPTRVNVQSAPRSSSAHFANSGEYREAVVRELVAIIRAGEKPTQERLSDAFNVSRALPAVDTDGRQIRRWNDEFGLDWADLKSEARARVYSLTD